MVDRSSWNLAAMDAAPNNAANVPGAWDAFQRLADVDQRMDILPGIFKDAIKKLAKKGLPVKYILDGASIADANGTITVKAMVRYVEYITGRRAYAHLLFNYAGHTHDVIRIGNVITPADRAETRGGLLMGRARDALVDDPQGIYLRENGVPAEFATMSAVPSPSKEPAGYPLFPFTNKKGKLITKTSKPRNSWIIYRAERHAAVKAANPTLHVSQLSAIIREEWANMDVVVRTLYNEMSDEERLYHFQTFPEYQLKPRKSEDIKRRPGGQGQQQVDFAVQFDVSPDVDALSLNCNL
ncbi:hypothetical protein EG329_007233 [Mollisiaceae sp. DMI_Dod_QoI]|nr:hypothetical protein EG329_007233 [Helotiales sp. DMI_Dod_QoI]